MSMEKKKSISRVIRKITVSAGKRCLQLRPVMNSSVLFKGVLMIENSYMYMALWIIKPRVYNQLLEVRR